jgi:hypothetical protein
MIRAEEVLCELMRTPEYANDAIVHAHVQAWRRGTADAGRVLLDLVRTLSRNNARLMNDAIRKAMYAPGIVTFVNDTLIRGVPPADAPGERRCVPLSEVLSGDPVFVTAAGELVAEPRGQ